MMPLIAAARSRTMTAKTTRCFGSIICRRRRPLWFAPPPSSSPPNLRHFSTGNALATDAGPVTAAYQRLVEEGTIRRDEEQVALASRLDALHRSLQDTDSQVPPSEQLVVRPEPFSLQSSIRHRQTNRRRRKNDPRQPPPVPPLSQITMQLFYTFSNIILGQLNKFFLQPKPPPRGLYIYGSVGVGKSRLMDLFYETATFNTQQQQQRRRRGRRRAHFHEFMLDVHDRIHHFKQRHPQQDPIPPVALSLAQDARILCFDEFQVTDIADAMILRRLFGILFEQYGVVVVATSNRAPEDLYQGGLNRHLFLPFIDVLQTHCEVFGMTGQHDYRRDNEYSNMSTTAKSRNQQQSYFCPHHDNNDDDDHGIGSGTTTTSIAKQQEQEQHQQALNEIFQLGKSQGNNQNNEFNSSNDDTSLDWTSEAVPVRMGRTVQVPRSNETCAWFDFRSLCHQPLGAADYLALCERYSTIIVDDVPQLGAAHFNEARRFVTLVDAVYENRETTRLVLAAQVPLDQLFVEFDTTVETSDGDEEIAQEEGKDVDEQQQQEDDTMWVKGEGGSSSSSSTTMIRTKEGGEMEWSATGRVGVSLAQLSAVRDVAFSFRRAESRLVEMMNDGTAQ
jgi:protein AFG1